MNLLDRILALDYSHPALWYGLAGVLYVVLREVGPRAWRTWKRLRDTRDPMDVHGWTAEGRRYRERLLGLPEAAAIPAHLLNLNAPIEHPTATEIEVAVRAARPAHLAYGPVERRWARWAKWTDPDEGRRSLSDEDYLARHGPAPAGLTHESLEAMMHERQFEKGAQAYRIERKP